ncbi:MAG: DNA recombination protein RmuC [Verrucomicrobia bacterium]|nr:DNA recombination protein RmuC [Verrucomicrobiota bacterium]
METTLLIIIAVLLLIAIILIIVFRNKGGSEIPQLQNKVSELQSALGKLESGIKDDFRTNREENATIAKDNRTELNNTLKDFKTELSDTLKNITEQNQQALKEINKTLAEKVDALITKVEDNNKASRETLAASLKDFTLEQRNKFDELKQEQKDLTAKTVEQLEKITGKVEEKLNNLNEQAKSDNNLMRDALVNAFKGFQETFDKNVKSFNDLQKEKFELLEAKQNDLVKGTETKLDIIRATVEEKLEKTLSERLGQSFETVGKQLIEVQKGLGEMQTIASDVGGLKKVLSNVKLRGGVGEVQLAMLLEQILAPNQYEANVKTKKGSTESVEFAIKLPGRSEDEKEIVYLPVDAKFPKDTYENLINAYENAIPDDIEAASKSLEITIRKMAKDIRDKYIDPPNTTDFAIMFLPFESIYAEVIRRSALVDQLRDEYKITVAGPTTLMAILNSLQMGFRTLALQKRSSEVWKVLGSVKKEFESFGGLLEKAQKNIQTGLGQLDDVVGTRTRAIQRQLRNVESLPAVETQNILPEILDTETEEDKN